MEEPRGESWGALLSVGGEGWKERGVCRGEHKATKRVDGLGGEEEEVNGKWLVRDTEEGRRRKGRQREGGCSGGDGEGRQALELATPHCFAAREV